MVEEHKIRPLGSFLGGVMSQTQKAIWLWEMVLNKYKFSRFIDMGTWRGNLSFYFYLFCLNRNAEFYTFDVRETWHTPLKEKLGFGEHFKNWDIFQHIEEIGQLIAQTGQTILYCDNGKKAREFNTFAPFLKKGDIIAVHDWKTEVPPEAIETTKIKYSLQEIFSKESDEEEMTRFFERYA